MPHSDSLSELVANLLRPAAVHYEQENHHETFTLLTWPTASTCLTLIDEDATAGLPRLELDSGPLSPTHLLDCSRHDQADETTKKLEEERVDLLFDDKPDDAMAEACRRLYMAALVARQDVMRLAETKIDWQCHGLSDRLILAWELLLLAQSYDKDDKVALLSATQLLLAELDATLEKLAQPRGDGNHKNNKEALSTVAHWRIRDLVHAVRTRVGVPLSLVLHLLVGPLNGICLRNLVWHGYVGPEELGGLPWPHLLWLVVALGLGQFTSNLPFTTENAETMTILTPTLDQMDPWRGWNVTQSDLELLLAASPTFVPRSMEPALQKAVQLCQDGSTAAIAPDRWQALAILYSILERGLRRLFAQANPNHFSCNQDDKKNPCLARTNQLHITLATMLKSIVGDDNLSQSKNGLLDYLGEGFTAALYDEFVWMGLPDASENSTGVEPLPCRNELVHGTLELSNISQRVVVRVLHLVLGLAARTVATCPTTLPTNIRACLENLQTYQPRRHPACQVWRLFRGVLRGKGHCRVKMVREILSPNKKTTATRQTNRSSNLLERVDVKYCPVCTLPFEYCCYTKTAVSCLEYRFGSSQSVALPEVMRLAREIAFQFEKHGVELSGTDNDEHILASQLNERRNALISTILLQSKMINGVPEQGSNDIWHFLDGPPSRRCTSEVELSKLWNVREAILRSGQTAKEAYRRLLQVLTLASSGKTCTGRKKEPLGVVLSKLKVTLQAAELVLLMAMEQYLGTHSTSLAVPIFLSAFANTLWSNVDQGHVRSCVAMSAGLGKDDDVCRRLVDKLPPADRGKFVLNVDKYLENVAARHQHHPDAELLTNKFALGIAGAAAESNSSGTAWESLRRWQLTAREQ